MDIFDKVKLLNLPIGSYTIIGSGSLEAHCIRPAKDVDILVTTEGYPFLKDQGWEEVHADIEPRRKLVRDAFEASDSIIEIDNPLAPWNPNPNEIIAHSEIIDGVAFMSLEDLKKFKLALGRNKDLADIELINGYLSTKH